MTTTRPETKRLYHVRDLAERYGTNQSKVLIWIARGELAAIDTSSNPGIGRPRWKITPEAVEAFEASRSSRRNIQPKTTPRRRRSTGVTRYF